MIASRRSVVLGVVAGLCAVSCGGNDANEGQSTVAGPAVSAPSELTVASAPERSVSPPPQGSLDTSPATSGPLPNPSELSESLFDPTVLHEIDMQISDRDLDLLDEATDDRVPVILSVDGETAVGAGVRLKGVSQFQGMDLKPAFSIETDEFVDGLELFDVDRFTLGNATWDHSFVAEQLVYEIYRAAGIPAARTALARVSVNGETFGLYVIRETYAERWLEQYFTDPTGNLYEAPGGGPDTVLELRTNERDDDTSDLDAVAEVVATATDDEYRDAIGRLVDVDELTTYWAIEALTAHWDGYAYDLTAPGSAPDAEWPPGNPFPNNFYAYHDPDSGRFVILPHGADLSFGLGAGITYDIGPSTPVLIAPKADATIAARLWADPAFRAEFADRVRWVLDEVWDVAGAHRTCRPPRGPGPLERVERFARVRHHGRVRGSVGRPEGLPDPAARRGAGRDRRRGFPEWSGRRGLSCGSSILSPGHSDRRGRRRVRRVRCCLR